ncbi:MAG: TonB-dependent receptor [Chloroherpetonaceae bacterium]|nr:TonB-dependent receptor [Chloroherpetonaceae bacterium]
MKPRYRRLTLYWLYVLLTTLIVTNLQAQETGDIRGVVTDAADSSPIIGASVFIPDLKLGTTTNVNGEFIIRKVPVGTYNVVARYVGYKPQTKQVTVRAGTTVEVAFSLVQSSVQADELVVTGQGTVTSKRQLPAPVETISSKDIERTSAQSIDQLLQGQVPGLSSFNAQGLPGTGARIQTRGIKSALSNTTPVIYIDGIRVDNGDNFRLANGTGGAVSSALADIVVGDIERVEVIKGGAASTLYGSEAANGVIQIFTKKGRPGEAKVRFTTINGVDMPETRFTFEEATRTTLYRPAFFNRQALNITGGSEALTYNASGSVQHTPGVFKGDELSNTLYNFTGSLRAILSPKSEMEFFATYTRNQFGRALLNNAYDALPLSAMEAGSFFAPGNYVAGAGFTQNRDSILQFLLLPDMRETVNRFTSGLTFGVTPIKEWTNTFRVGVDYRKNEQRILYPVAAIASGIISPPSSLSRSERDYLTLTIEYAGTLKLPDLGIVSQTLSFGARGFRVEDREFDADGQNIAAGTDDFDNAAIINSRESNQALFNGGLYLQDQIGIADNLFINLAMRVDINTTFGADVGTQFYPTAGIAYNIGDEAFFPAGIKDILSSLKLRASYGRTGFFPTPFARDRTFTVARNTATTAGINFGNPGNRNLGPEITTSIDFGFDAGFWNDRIAVEFSYYTQTTDAALFDFPQDPSGGRITQLQNVGQIRNRGIELSVRAAVYQSPTLDIAVRGAVSTVDNLLVSLGGSAPFTIGGFAFLPMRAEEGYPLGVYQVTVPKPDADGQYTGDFTTELYGSPTPTVFGSFGVDFTIFKDLTVSLFGEFAAGHYTLNQALDTRFYQGYRDLIGEPIPSNATPQQRAEISRRNYENGKLPNDNYVTDNASILLVQPADWIKIREISARYRVPQSLIGNLLSSVVLSFNVRNPFVFGTRATGVDPELGTVRSGRQVDLGGVANLAVSPPIQYRFGIEITP